jgi:competence protein ComEC
MRWRGAEHAASLRDCLECELGERAGFQWLAVAVGAGCLIYFALLREPLLLALLSGSLAAAVGATIRYRRDAPWRIVGIVALCLAGATAAKLRVDSIAGPQIEREFSATLSGRVVERESRTERRPRIVLDLLRSEASLPERLPSRIRLTIGEKYGLPPLGARISVPARLMPVPGPAVPGGYDPRRAAFFEGIGGSGFVLGGWRMLEPPDRAR